LKPNRKGNGRIYDEEQLRETLRWVIGDQNLELLKNDLSERIAELEIQDEEVDGRSLRADLSWRRQLIEDEIEDRK